MLLYICVQIEADIIEMMEKALKYTDVIVGCSSAHYQFAVQYRTAKIHHRLASLYHNALRNDVSIVSREWTIHFSADLIRLDPIR